MTYGTIKVDTVTFTNAGVDKSVTLSGLVQNPVFSGNVTVTGTLSGVTVTGATANFTSGNFTNISGGTHTITSGVFAAGSAASPSITFTGDLNTGIYSPGADQVAISTGGSGRLFINGSGNVGVGVTPSARFHISESSPAAYVGQIIENTSSTGYTTTLFRIGSAGGSGEANINYAPGLFFALGPQANDTTTPIVLKNNNGQERLRITSAGLVGVGTSDVQDQLHVEATNGNGIRLSRNSLADNEANDIDFTYRSGATYYWAGKLRGIKRSGGGGDLQFFTSSDGNTEPTTPAVVIDKQGRLAVGTTSPTAQIDSTPADGGNAYAIRNWPMLRNTGTTLDIGGYGSSQWLATRFYTNSSIAMMIDSSQRVGIGTTGPSGTLHVLGGSTVAILQRTGANACQINVGDSNLSNIYYDADAHIYRAGAGTERMRIDSSGRVGIGTSSPAGTLHLAATYPLLYLTDTDATGSARSAIGSPDGNLVYYANENNQTGGSHIFYRNGANESVRIDSSGRVGIGTTSPGGMLHVAGATILGDNGTNGRCTIETNTSRIALSATTTGFAAYQNLEVYSAATIFYRGATESARLDSSGRLLVGTSSVSAAGTVFLQGNSLESNGGAILQMNRGTATPAVDSTLGAIYFGDSASSTGATLIAQRDGGTWSGSSKPSRLVFSTTRDGQATPTEAFRVDRNGNLLVATTNSNIGGTTTVGLNLNAEGIIRAGASSSAPCLLNRITNDGELIFFQQDGNTEGSISVSGTTVSYNGAHLSRWSQLSGGAERTEILRGSVLSNIDEMCEWGEEDNEQLNRMKVSDVEGDKNVSGVFQAWDDDDDTYTNDFYCAMTGDFIIRIGAGVTVERGDLLMSAGDGTAKPQDDDIIRSKTIAKVTSTNVSCTYDDGSYCVPCVLMAC